ncbi:uncharacterized protein DUF4381 [Chitinophaga skermanii]|uniref:Uncharacterized protein DUF4381 n=1 Tax=Chitinophaga skermanii TaxID=331697 RepID=A0A327QFN3_9BACT|nr:DUF4381 domain-containing protein [Chitinophaga skermanii]RAJ02432.1 uncharacterized protein DUF4381 [Chitinophaga skermanii]
MILLFQHTTQQFDDVIEPPPVKFSFNEPGWYVVGVLFVLIVALCVYLVYQYYKRNRYRKSALRYLQEREKYWKEQQQDVPLIYETSMLLKRLSMRNYGRGTVAYLYGKDWINFLNTTWKEHSFTEEEGQMLFDTLYRKPTQVDKNIANGFIEKTKRWIIHHKHAV